MSSTMHLAVIGDERVGKSALVIQCAHNEFGEEYDQPFAGAYRRQAMVGDDAFMLEIEDVAAKRKDLALREVPMHKAQGFVVVYSITSRSSFKGACTHMDMVYRARERDNVPMVLVGNKCDLERERQVSTAEGRELAQSRGFLCPFFETSARTAFNVLDVFLELARQVKRDMARERERRNKEREEEGWCGVL